jgi:NAD(P)H-hydrate epimerase
VPTGSEASAFDRDAIDRRGVPETALMESAGRAAADLADRLAPSGRVVVVAGRGNNGGDGVVLARTLHARGRDVRLVRVGRSSDDPLLHGWTVPSAEASEDVLRDLDGAALVVDGVLGTGLRGAPRAPAASVIERLARFDGPVLSLDVPSGVVADTGEVPGPAVRAAVTIAFGWPKLGSLLEPGRSRSGRLVVAEIGFPPLPRAGFGATLLTPAWADGVMPVRDAATHKNRVGAVLVVAGGAGMGGAALLAARAALRAGAGYVRVAADPSQRSVFQAALPDAPFVALDDAEGLAAALAASRAVVTGPGLGTSAVAEAALALVLDADRPGVLDADALNLVAAGRPRPLGELPGNRALVLTPHPGEAARLLGRESAAVQADRPAAARALAAESGAVVVLKGTPSLVAGPGRPLGVSALASSDFAVAGMGDVLAGATGAFLAQGVEPASAAGLALLGTARAALRTGFGPGLAASDVVEALPGALAERGPGETDLPFPWVTLDLEAPS